MFSNYVLSRGNASMYGRSTAGCTFGSRLGTPNPRYLNGLIDEYYRPMSRYSRRTSSSRSRSRSPADMGVRGSSRKANRSSSNRSRSSRASSAAKDANQEPSTAYPPWYNDEDIRRFELVRRIREETSRVPKNSDKYDLVSGLSRPTSVSSRSSSRASSRRGSFTEHSRNMWEPVKTQKATRRDAQKTIQRLVRAQSRGKKVVFDTPTMVQQPIHPAITTDNQRHTDTSSDSYEITNAHPRLSTLQFYGKFLGSQALPKRRARRLQSLLDETPVFYAPNGDTVVLQDSEGSDSSATDTEHLARNAISGLMNLISEDGASLSKPLRTRSSRRYTNEHRQDISMDECIDLSKPGEVLLTDRNSLESRYRLCNQQRVLRPVLEQSTAYSSNHVRG
ncbi:Hypothetical protein GLP15_1707 [Giardia lamblia P15]|uniref:Uncharacterized protein n=1 Tax=Giardia intestinalis (strain P15) TaxID=658858 RepID=E1EW26_GIAIA|nr:Hypothetical protein GLP15_1707 [Giardia lamblia P15]